MAGRIKSRNIKETLKLAEQRVSFGLKGRNASRVTRRATLSRDYFLGKHKIKSRPDQLGNKVYNKYSEVFENKVAHYTSAQPKWVFAPQEETDLFGSKAIDQVLGDVVWERSRWHEKGEDSNLEAAHAGSCHIKPGIDDMGYPTFAVFPCESVIPDPSAQSVEQLQFIAWLTVKTPEEIERDYNVKIGDRTGDYLGKVKDDSHGSFTRPSLSYFKGASNKVENVWALLDRDEGRDTKDELGRVTVVEFWLEDLSREAIPFTDEEADAEHARMAETLRLVNPKADEHHIKHLKAHQEFLETLNPEEDKEVYALITEHIALHEDFPQSSTRPAYPDGRIITVTQGILLRDEPNPFGIHWRDMVIKFDYLKNRNEYWGKPLGVDMIDPQDDFNHRKNMITQNINLLQNGIRKLKKGFYKKKALDYLGNLVGRTIEVNTEGDFTVDFGKPLPPDHWNDVNHIESFMDRQAGNTDVLAGRLPAPGTSGVTIDQLIQQSGVRFGLPLRHYAHALQKMGRIAISLMMRFLDNSEVFSILGPNHKIQPVEWEQLKQNFIRPDGSIKHIRIDIQSITASSRAREEQIALQRLRLGAYDVQAYLEKIDDPAKYQIMERLSQVNQLKQAVEGLQAQNDQLKKELNTTLNRLQSQEGRGNVSAFRTQG